MLPPTTTFDDLPDPLTADMLVFRARGRDRAVYDIRAFPQFLAKIVHQDSASVRKVFAHEAEFLARRSSDALPIARVLGHRATALGRARIDERIMQADHSLAPSISKLLHEGSFNDTHLAAINRFVRDAIEGHIPLSDFDLRNLVYGYRAGEPEPRIFVVDGYGDKTFIQIKLWWRWANTPHILRKFGRLPKGCAIRWDRRARRYEWVADPVAG
ncbi:MAG: YrbL family protein [Pseudomonadota bacterium]